MGFLAPTQLLLLGSSVKDLSFTNAYTLSSVVVGEGNGTPLQYSCLENPMDGGA